MLVESWSVRQALERAQFALPKKHKRVFTPGRTAPCLRVRLRIDGSVAAVEDVPLEEWPSWTVMEGNQNSFPVVRVQTPLALLPCGHQLWGELGYEEKGKRWRPPAPEQRVDALKRALSLDAGRDGSTKSRGLWERLAERKAPELEACAPDADTLLSVVRAVASRFALAARDPSALVSSVADDGLARLEQGRLAAIEAVEWLIVGNGPPNEKGRRPTATVQLAFDVDEPGQFPAPMYGTQVREALIEVLPEKPATTGAGRGAATGAWHGEDALTGEESDLEDSSFPFVELPTPSSRSGRSGVGRKRFPLASMFSEAGCNKRYGMTDARVFPLARKTATHLKEALEFITADERRGKTWEHVASGRFVARNRRKVEKPDLLIAFVEEAPLMDAAAVRWFGQGQHSAEARFEVDATAVCAALQGIARARPRSRLALFLVREVSKGQAQVALALSPTVPEALEAAEWWQAGVAQNLPTVTLPLPPKEGSQHAVDAVPLPPYPDQVVRLLSHQWVRDGSSPRKGKARPAKPNHEVAGPGLGDVLHVMLRTAGRAEPAARRLVAMLVQRLSPLLVGVAGAVHAYGPRQAAGRPEPLYDYPRESRDTSLRGVAVLGILLSALGERKETYMRDAAFQVGQALALADTLHKDYCIVVRKGVLPNSLIGTALMRRALDSPAGAVADLAERIIEYVRWAKTEQESTHWPEDKKIALREAWKKLRQYQLIAGTLAATQLPTACSDVEKAQLLLGFLASPPSDALQAEGKEQ